MACDLARTELLALHPRGTQTGKESLARSYGQLIESGGPELAKTLEEKGYDWVREKYIKPVA